LKDAELVAIVSYADDKKQNVKIAELPVTQGREAGHYQVSWTQPTAQVRTGTYVVSFYREVDRLRSDSPSQSDTPTETLFTVSFYHQKVSAGLFVRSEVLAIVVVGSTFFWLVWQKMEMEGTRKKAKKGKK